jgi:hypothetical protein
VTEPAPGPPAIPGLPEGSRPALELVVRLHGEKSGDLRLADLPSDFLYELAKDPPGSGPVRLGAAVAVFALRRATAARGRLRWPVAVDPADPALRREGYRLAALAIVALTSRTKVGISGEDPDRRPLVEERPEDSDLIDGFMASEREILRRKERRVDYAPEEFLADMRDVPRRMEKPGRILPEETEPTHAGPYRFTPNHDDRVVRLYDYFRDKYGSPRGERRADLYLALLAYVSRRREALEAEGAVFARPGGKIGFREGYLEELLERPLGWFESA